MALGANRAQVLAMVVREALPVAAAGIIAGLLAAAGLTRLMESLLYEVKPTDPAIFALAPITLGIPSIAACIAPALKAARTDPATALR